MSDLRPLIHRPSYRSVSGEIDSTIDHNPPEYTKTRYRRQTSGSFVELISLGDEPAQEHAGRERVRSRSTIPAEKINTWQRLVPLLSILLPSTISVLVGALTFGDFRSTSTVLILATKYRAQLQVAIHVISTILVLPWSYSICTTFNLWTRTQFWHRPASLFKVRFWAAISQARIVYSQPAKSLLLCATMCLLSILPGFLWTGALTPVFVSTEKFGNITVMAHGPDSWPFFTNSHDLADCLTTPYTLDGWSTTCPGYYRSGALLETASSAITVDRSPRNHSKPDNSGYQYSGRSYGVGAAVGLNGTRITFSDAVQGFSYTEVGYATNVSCIYNSSSLWVISLNLTNNPGYIPNLFNAQGWLPSSNMTGVPGEYLNRTYLSLPENQLYGKYQSGWFSQVAAGANNRMVSIGATTQQNPGQYYVVLAAGAAYDNFDTIQCEVDFNPSAFNVSVSTSDRIIKVAPSSSTKDPESKGNLRTAVMINLDNISQQETNLYLSTVGNAFNNSLGALWTNRSAEPDFNAEQARESIPLEAVEESLAAMIDDILIWNALYGTMMRNGTTTTRTKLHIAAYRVGTPSFAIATFAVHVVAFLAVLGVSIYSRFWRETKKFDYADAISLSVSALAGAKTYMPQGLDLANWNGNPRLPDFDRIRFRPAPVRNTGSLNLTLISK